MALIEGAAEQNSAPQQRFNGKSCTKTNGNLSKSLCRGTDPRSDGIDVKEPIRLMDSFMAVRGVRAQVSMSAIEKPAASVGIALDVAKRNGINISLARLFGSFVPRASV
ncbi:hypothetical protein ACWGS9_05670 [Bradyrhizobium sp. Arg314]